MASCVLLWGMCSFIPSTIFFNSGDEPDLLSAAGNCKTNTIWGVQLSSKKTSDSEVSEKPDVVAFGRGEYSEVE